MRGTVTVGRLLTANARGREGSLRTVMNKSLRQERSGK